MARRYETVYIFDPALEEPAINERLERFHALLTKDAKGSITNVAHWGKRTLSYPIKKKDTGYYVVAQFETAAELLPEYERAVKLEEGVVRFLVVVSEGLPAKPEPAPAVIAADVVVDEIEEDEAGDGPRRRAPCASPGCGCSTTRTIARSAGFSPSAARFSRAGCRGCARDISASSPPRSSGRASSPCCPTSRGTSAEALAPRGRRTAVRRPGAGESRGAAVRRPSGRSAARDAR